MNDSTWAHLEALAKVSVAWILLKLSAITLNEVATTCAILYSGLQSYFLIRDKWWRERHEKDGV